MEDGDLGEELNPWGVGDVPHDPDRRPADADRAAAYGKWLDQRSDREDARRTASTARSA